ncbi:MAG: branched-chain-amino-acid transaminase [SAR86 cluster bacterium SAR86B]|jgi:branched-chain amino acid aminotransferase|uniref:Branched-chain-amino-acid aminotransferase n=1 Tax=SAR86 cluster bacterium SAR86B TaxID=1123867 RepID=J4KT49_9GAMM|nr:MAG: branched-chain-amino-acid transaminase [SAR86 cluster bacterium SAR86B]|tara:strand:+ start:171 stop:1091 length:921 start_codon:yes stop_codon:yes gene_type:complete
MFNQAKDQLIWKNGSLIKWDDSNVHILSHTLHYGTGVFEGVRAYNTDNGGAIFRLQDHTARLFDAASKLNIQIPLTADELNKAQIDVLKANNLNEAYIRPIVYLGNESLGIRATDLSVNVAVAAWEWPSYMSPEKKELGLSIIKSSHEQYSNSLHACYKIIGTYINSTMALHEALSKGADEALLLDKNGNISEGSGENIFIVKNGEIYTPKTDYCLNGLTRQSIIQIAKDQNIKVIETNLKYEDLVMADEAFFTGTAVEVTPITSIDSNKIGSGKRGEISHILQQKYSEIVAGKDVAYSSWLTYID